MNGRVEDHIIDKLYYTISTFCSLALWPMPYMQLLVVIVLTKLEAHRVQVPMCLITLITMLLLAKMITYFAMDLQ
jgi:hypothetical protein